MRFIKEVMFTPGRSDWKNQATAFYYKLFMGKVDMAGKIKKRHRELKMSDEEDSETSVERDVAEGGEEEEESYIWACEECDTFKRNKQSIAAHAHAAHDDSSAVRKIKEEEAPDGWEEDDEDDEGGSSGGNREVSKSNRKEDGGRRGLGGLEPSEEELVPEYPTPNMVLENALEADPNINEGRKEYIMDEASFIGYVTTDTLESIIDDLAVNNPRRMKQRLAGLYKRRINAILKKYPGIENEPQWHELLNHEMAGGGMQGFGGESQGNVQIQIPNRQGMQGGGMQGGGAGANRGGAGGYNGQGAQAGGRHGGRNQGGRRGGHGSSPQQGPNTGPNKGGYERPSERRGRRGRGGESEAMFSEPDSRGTVKKGQRTVRLPDGSRGIVVENEDGTEEVVPINGQQNGSTDKMDVLIEKIDEAVNQQEEESEIEKLLRLKEVEEKLTDDGGDDDVNRQLQAVRKEIRDIKEGGAGGGGGDGVLNQEVVQTLAQQGRLDMLPQLTGQAVEKDPKLKELEMRDKQHQREKMMEQKEIEKEKEKTEKMMDGVKDAFDIASRNIGQALVGGMDGGGMPGGQGGQPQGGQPQGGQPQGGQQAQGGGGGKMDVEKPDSENFPMPIACPVCNEKIEISEEEWEQNRVVCPGCGSQHTVYE